MPQTKKWVFYVGTILLILSMIGIVILGRGKTTENRSKAAPATVLTLTPKTISVKQGDEFTVGVALDTGGNVVSMVAPHLIYDPQKLTFLGFTRGRDFPQLVSDVAIKKENILLSVGAKSLADRIIGVTTVGEFRFRVNDIATGPTMLSFADSAYAGLVGPGTVNALVARIPTSIDIPQVLPDPPTSDRCKVHIPLASK